MLLLSLMNSENQLIVATSSMFRVSKGMSKLPYLLLFATVLLSSSSYGLKDLGSTALSPSLVSSGLKNLGNTCYMNSQLQCAFHIPLLRKLALENSRSGNPTVKNVDPDDQPSPDDSDYDMFNADEDEKAAPHARKESVAKIALREVFLGMIEASVNDLRAFAPRNFCLSLGIPPMVQQDSQEFWKLLLPALEQGSILDLYKGYFESYITALDGSGRERRREEVFLDLSLEVGKSSTLLGSLNESFGTPELLSESEGNGWRPEKGAEKVDAHKGSSLIAQGLPPILQFHLKRFTYDGLTDSMNKVNDRLAFPSELDLWSICKSAETGGSGASIYDLQSVVVHAGKYGMGHYYSYVRPDPKSDIWYRFNDDVVEEVTEKEVFEDAYGGRNKISTRSGAAQDKREIPVLGRLLRRLGGNGGYSYGFGGSESNAYVVQYVRRCDLGKLYLQ